MFVSLLNPSSVSPKVRPVMITCYVIDCAAACKIQEEARSAQTSVQEKWDLETGCPSISAV
jgi:hypothetical protein